MSDQKTYRLPLTVTPERYEIRLTPDLFAARFDGEEKIALQVHEPVEQIRLNAAELAFHSVSIQRAGGAMLPGDVSLDGDNWISEKCDADRPDSFCEAYFGKLDVPTYEDLPGKDCFPN